MLGTGSREDAKILATGGGAFVDPDTRARTLEKAIAVWIDGSVETLLERVSRKDNRPLLRQGNPREILTRLRDERAPFYAEAPIHIMSGHQPHGVTAHRILRAIDQWL